MITAALLLFSGIGLYLFLLPPWESDRFRRLTEKTDPFPTDARRQRIVVRSVPEPGMIPFHSSYRLEADKNE